MDRLNVAMFRVRFRRWTVSSLAAVIVMCATGCVVLPFPRFPEDPYATTLTSLLSQEHVSQEDALLVFGEPWANWDDRGYVYITDRPTLYLLGASYAGSAGEIEMSHRDFVLMISFDREGLMIGHEQFADTGKHNHCFGNGVCFSRKTGNVPLRPPELDGFSARELSGAVCTLNLYRAKPATEPTYDEYVDVYLEPVGSRDDGEALHERAVAQGVPVWIAGRSSNLLGRSVAGGVNRWFLQPNTAYRVKFGFGGVKGYPFTASAEQASRATARFDFGCDAGAEHHVSLTVPESLDAQVVVQRVDQETALAATRDLPVLLSSFR